MSTLDQDQAPLRLMIFDRSCRGQGRRPFGLSHVWHAGSWLYRALDRFDGVLGASAWHEALDWLCAVQPHRPIGEVQFWGHGNWGCARIGDDLLDGEALCPGHPLRPRLEALRCRLVDDGSALWWFRTCETFGALAGQRFARAWTDFLGCRAAGHTFVIGYYQSGLHSLNPGAVPSWSAEEGLARGTAAAPQEALWSRRGAPNTITCLQGRLPPGV